MKMEKDSPTLGYQSDYWEDDNLLNAESPKESAGDAKYAAFGQGPVDYLRICTDAPFGFSAARCMEHELPRVFASPKDLFKYGYLADDTIDQMAMYGIFEEHNRLECGMVLPGFNTYGSNDQSYARFGFMGQIPSQGCDDTDDDWALGIGLNQSGRCSSGAGVTCHWADGNNGAKSWNTWLYFRTTSAPVPPPFGQDWDIAMKMASGSSTLSYSSSYWTDMALLNENASPRAAGDAKYAAFLKGPVDKIRICTDQPYGTTGARCYEHALPSIFDSPKDLFSAGYVEDQTIDKMAFYSILDEHPRSNCDMVQPGFNTEMGNDVTKARFGFMGNVPSQECNSDDDWTMGIGIEQSNNSACAAGAGVSCYFAEGNDGQQSFNAWVYFHQV